jgi:hypothetical protein
VPLKVGFGPIRLTGDSRNKLLGAGRPSLQLQSDIRSGATPCNVERGSGLDAAEIAVCESDGLRSGNRNSRGGDDELDELHLEVLEVC